MEYMTAAEVAKKWSVTPRQVQRFLIADRIPGAKKHGRAWLIPADAEKPADPRFEHHGSGDPSAVLDTAVAVNEKQALNLENVIASYARGDFQPAIDYYHSFSEGDAYKPLGCMIAVPAAISLGDYPLFSEMEIYLKSVVEKGADNFLTAVAKMTLTTAYIGASVPHMAPDWLKEGDFSALPQELRLAAFHQRAIYLLLQRRYESVLALAQTAIYAYESVQVADYDYYYMPIMCACACHALERYDEAERYIKKAMDIALPNGVITPFAENFTGPGNLIPNCLKKYYPKQYKAVADLHERSTHNWLIFHGHFTKRNIQLILSSRDYQIARQVAMGASYATVAKDFGFSVGRLKQKMNEIYGTLYVSGRSELAEVLIFGRKSGKQE